MLFCVGSCFSVFLFCFLFCFFAVVTTVSILCKTIGASLIKENIHKQRTRGDKGHSRKFSLSS